MYKPQLAGLEAVREMIPSFKGYENNLVIDENAFFYTENTTGDYYPVLSPRNRRAFFNVSGSRLHGLFSKAKISYVNNGVLYYGGEEVTGLSFPDIDKPRKFVSLGARLIIFPDNVYVNTNDFSDFGYLEAQFNTGKVTLSFCKGDGVLYEGYAIRASAPEEPADGDLWLDSSSKPNTLNQYSEALGIWMPIAETYVKVTCPGIGKAFKEYDAVSFSGFNADLDTTHIIRHCGEDYIVVSGIIDDTMEIEGELSVKREIPEMDFVCESGNRIWGCSSERNEIYASKLGDPTNFNVYMGISTDSYAATVGTDGPFTGAVSYRGYVLFFKENCVHKVYGQNPPYTITTSFVRGVQKGSEKSLVSVNETLYYKSPNGVCAYEGGMPVTVSSSLGNNYYTDAVAGALNNKYYVCMSDKDGVRHLFSYDEEKLLWHREDSVDIREFASNNSNLYFLMNDNGVKRIGLIDGENVYGSFTGSLKGYVLEDKVSWVAESGIWGLSLPENKYYSNINIRATGEKNAVLDVEFQYDSNGKWVKQLSTVISRTGSVNLPFVTPRCDHMRIRLKGKGKIKILSISRKTEAGSELNV